MSDRDMMQGFADLAGRTYALLVEIQQLMCELGLTNWSVMLSPVVEEWRELSEDYGEITAIRELPERENL